MPDDIVTKRAGAGVGANIDIDVGEPVSFRDPTNINVENPVAVVVGGRVTVFAVGCSVGALVNRLNSGPVTGTLPPSGLLPPLGL
jgi:hypothetical protein